MVVRRWAAKLGLVSLIVIGLLIAVIKGMSYLTGPVHATDIPASATPISSAPSFDMQPIPISNPYASFTYPAALKPMPTQSPHGSALVTYTYGYRDIESWELNITVNRLAEPILTDDGGYDFRKVNPNRYEESTTTIGQNSFKIMSDTTAGGFSKVAFNLHGSLSADISLYGDDPNGQADLNATFQQILSSWQWHE
jgi:hypothetical protein